MEKNNVIFFSLSKKMTIFLFVYYTILLLIGAVTSITIACGLMNGLSKTQLLMYTFIASLSVSGMLCSIRYIKRLYTACISGRIKISSDFFEILGNMAYFILRPFFSFVFVIIMIFALLSGMFIVTGNLDYIINDKFLYLSVIISSFIGFSIGKILDKFEIISNKKIDAMK